jgi:Putative Flp pilus-assembly TadE/G-like
MERRLRGAGGQAVLLLVAVIGLVAVVIVAVVDVAVRLDAHARAETAADAAALAGSTGGRRAAERLATANGGVLVGFSDLGDRVVAVVELDGQRATAAATADP